MKKHLIFAIMISISVSVFAQKKGTKTFNFNPNIVEKSLAKINENLYASKYEVSNDFYRYFEKEIRKSKKTEDLNFVIPDTNNWKSKLAYNEPYVQYYYRHPAYNNYPMVNISHEAAVLFCKWLTEQYNTNPKRKFKKVIFRLPTLKEWEYAAKGGIDESPYPWGVSLFENGNYQCNFRRIGAENIIFDSISNSYKVVQLENIGIAGSLNDNADITAPVNAYFQNGYGLYNMSGNVKEMIDVKGVAKGGGWRSPGGDVMIKSVSYYKNSETDLGFRYFMEVLEK